jgi:hypothetical protein
MPSPFLSTGVQISLAFPTLTFSHVLFGCELIGEIDRQILGQLGLLDNFVACEVVDVYRRSVHALGVVKCEQIELVNHEQPITVAAHRVVDDVTGITEPPGHHRGAGGACNAQIGDECTGAVVTE